MAKPAEKKKFPSPANVTVHEGKAVASPSKGPMPEKVSVGKKQDLVQLHYSGENSVILHNGVHAISKGINHLPKDIFEEAQKHPNIAKLVKDGKLKVVGSPAEKAEEPVELEESKDEDDSEQAAETAAE
jgi:hypothetical protein